MFAHRSQQHSQRAMYGSWEGQATEIIAHGGVFVFASQTVPSIQRTGTALRTGAWLVSPVTMRCLWHENPEE